jgi:GH43 family beta-xylosidase
MSRPRLWLLLLWFPLAWNPVAAQAPRATFRNPLKRQGADPWLTYFDGSYYLSTTTGRDLRMRRARRIAELKDAPDAVVWRDDTPTRSRSLWAPEFHRLDGGSGLRWYAYYTATDDKEPHHRMFVLESQGDRPLGPYAFKAQLRTDPDDAFYAIDGTVLKLSDGRLYFIWCGRPCPAGQGLFISRMTNPWTLAGPRVYLEADGFGCAVVREGPNTLQRGGKVFLVYSACGADTPDYKLGMLIADARSELTDPASWKQHPGPVFTRNDAAKVYGPGHNTFFKSPDGKEDWITYHAKTGTGLTFADRTARAQPFTWNPDGTPSFGRPLATETQIPVPSGEPGWDNQPGTGKSDGS